MRMLRNYRERSTNSRISPMKSQAQRLLQNVVCRLGEQVAETINGDLDFMKKLLLNYANS